jgi:hypothetical protein
MRIQAWEIWKIWHEDTSIIGIVGNLFPLEIIPIVIHDGSVVIDVPHPILITQEELVKKIGVLEEPLIQLVAMEYIKRKNL